MLHENPILTGQGFAGRTGVQQSAFTQSKEHSKKPVFKEYDAPAA
ncbi:hypothetical protein STRDD11_01770 [Streptococcus sp. DD11]|nr:hypothetical protein STRDD11_01770 [Streptococcus sp. DD11]